MCLLQLILQNTFLSPFLQMWGKHFFILQIEGMKLSTVALKRKMGYFSSKTEDWCQNTFRRMGLNWFLPPKWSNGIFFWRNRAWVGNALMDMASLPFEGEPARLPLIHPLVSYCDRKLFESNISRYIIQTELKLKIGFGSCTYRSPIRIILR